MGLGEMRTGIRCIDNFEGRGRKRAEEKIPGLEEDVRAIAELHTQADPAVKSSLTYTRITGESLKKPLSKTKATPKISYPRLIHYVTC